MKPPERAPGSNGAKHGSVLPDAMRGTRLPSSSCAQPQELPLNQALSHLYSYQLDNLSSIHLFTGSLQTNTHSQ